MIRFPNWHTACPLPVPYSPVRYTQLTYSTNLFTNNPRNHRA
jgi:hypothetical protein